MIEPASGAELDCGAEQSAGVALGVCEAVTVGVVVDDGVVP